MRIDFLGLEAFVAIAEHGSFQRAAETLHLSQTALSHRLRKIEADLGAPLLIRSPREVSLTREGQDLLVDARRLLKELNDSYSAARARARHSRRKLSFACLPTIAHTMLPEVLRAFASDMPDIALTLHDVAAHRIAEIVQTGQAEFGITIVSAQMLNLRVRALFDEPYELLVTADHPLASRDAVSRADMADLIMARISTQYTNRQLVDDALGEERDSMDWRYAVQNASMAMALVACGAAATILPRSAGDYAPPGVVRVPFSDIRMFRAVGIVTQRGVPLSKPAEVLLKAIEQRLDQAARARTDRLSHQAHPD